MTCDSCYELTLVMRLDSDWIRPVTVTLNNATVSSSKVIGSACHVAKIIDEQTVQLSLPLKCDPVGGGGLSGLDTGIVVVDPESSDLDKRSGALERENVVDPEISGLDTGSVVVDLGGNDLEAGFIVLDPGSTAADLISHDLDTGSLVDPEYSDTASHAGDTACYVHEPESGSCGPGRDVLDSGTADVDLIRGDLDTGSLVVDPGCCDTDTESALVELGISDIDAASHDGDTGTNSHEPESGSYGPWEHDIGSGSVDLDTGNGGLDTGSVADLGSSDLNTGSSVCDTVRNGYDSESGLYDPGSNVLSLKNNVIEQGCSVTDHEKVVYVSPEALSVAQQNGVSGPRNSGPRNSGSRNSGPRISGPRISGPRNSGPRISGSRNSGPRISGPRISGPRNSGSRNSGPRNSGPRISGPRNSGPRNNDLGNRVHDPGCDVAIAVVSLGARCDYALTKRVPVDNAKNKDYRPYMSDYDLPITPAELLREHSYSTYCMKKKKKKVKTVIAKLVDPIPETNLAPESNDDCALSEYSDSSMSEDDIVEYKDDPKADPDWDPVCRSDVVDKPATRQNSTEAPVEDGDNDNVDRGISKGSSDSDGDSGSGTEADTEVDKTKKLGCRSCDYRCPSQMALRCHVTVKHHAESSRNGKRICTDCGQVEDTIEALQQHREAEHSKMKEYKCAVCREIFISYFKYRTHIQGHEHKFKCSKCECAFLVKKSLLLHDKKTHNAPVIKNRNSHMCEICGFQSSYQHVKDHQIGTHGVDFGERFACPECKDVFPSNYQMKKHIKRTHNCVKPTCDICHKVFAHYASLHEHLRNVHWRTDLEVHACPHCSKKFATNHRIREHIDTVHMKLRKYRCTWPGCVKSFGKGTHLKVHMRIHKDDKPLACPHCDFRARQRHALNYHLSRNHKDVDEDSAKDVTEAPNVADRSAKDVTEAPNVADRSAKDVTEAPNVADSSAKDVTEAPNVAEDSAKDVTEAPNVAEDSAKDVAEAPNVADDSAKDVAEAPNVADDSAKDVAEAPNVADDSAKDVAEAPNVADDSAKDVAEAPNVADDSAKDVAEAPNVADDSAKELTTSQGVTSESTEQ